MRGKRVDLDGSASILVNPMAYGDTSGLVVSLRPKWYAGEGPVFALTEAQAQELAEALLTIRPEAF